MIPLSAADIPTFEAWLEKVNHPEWRKKEYRAAYAKWTNGEVDKKKLKTKKCFGKREFYDKYKYHRCIHSPTDYEKVVHGRYAQAIESQLFKRPEFIKKIPRAEWPQYIQNRVGLPGLRVYGSDYTSFEANFVPEIQQACELQLVSYMLQEVLHEEGPQDILEGDGEKRLESKLFIARILGRRSSGQMETSLFNGFSNEMFNLFTLSEIGATIVHCVVEGDDGLFAHNAPRDPTSSDFLRLGLTIKIEPVLEWNKASFCGVVADRDVLASIVNPWRVVCTASWAGETYLRANKETLKKLAQIKGLSYLAQYPGCPVVQSIAYWMLRTSGFERERLEELLQWYQEQVGVSWWEKQVIREIRKSALTGAPVMDQSRLIMEEVFHVPRAIQARLEALFEADESGCVDLDPSLVPEMYRKNWEAYVRMRDRMERDLNVPYHVPEAKYPAQLGVFKRELLDGPDYYFQTMVPV